MTIYFYLTSNACLHDACSQPGHDTQPDSDALVPYKRGMQPFPYCLQDDAYELNAGALLLLRNVERLSRDRRDVPGSYFLVEYKEWSIGDREHKTPAAGE